jgi:hypothetical protein
MIQRKKRNSSKVNLSISLVFHVLLIAAAGFFAAREGILGKKLKELTVTMVPKEKPPEPPKQKEPEPKVETPKPVEPIPQPNLTPKVETAVVPPPANDSGNAAPPVAAPAPASLPAFEFSDGAKAVETASGVQGVYKSLVEYQLRSRWNRPDDIDDTEFVAEVEVTLDGNGAITSVNWLKLSGNARWDASVKTAVAQTKAITRRPPNGFPGKFVVRFDVESQKTEPVIQVGSR